MNNLITSILSFSFLLLSGGLFAQEIEFSTESQQVKILHIAGDGLSLEMNLSKIQFKKETFQNKVYYTPIADEFGNNVRVGEPNIPVYRTFIEFPTNADISFTTQILEEKIISLSDYGIHSLFTPKQRSLEKKVGIEPHFEMNNEVYNKNEFYSLKTATVTEMGTMRATSMARLDLSPYSYNPVTNELKVITKMKVAVQFLNADVSSYLSNKDKYWSPSFQSVSEKLINASVYLRLPPTGVQFPLTYVIVADSMFKSSLQPFVQWKSKQGYKVIEAYMQNAGVGYTATQIKVYLKGLYQNATAAQPAPSYVLFVGDVAQMPSNAGTSNPTNHITDLHYCEYTNDYLPEVHHGRFSANNATELEAQVQKTITYQKYLMANPSYLSKSVLIAGQDGSFGPKHGDGQINYAKNNFFNSSNNNSPYVYLHAVSGSSDAAIIANVNSGVGFVNYTAHGSWQGWVSPSFSVSDANALTNTDKYPVVIGNACETNRFEKSVCFGEALLRGQNKGAVAYIGASNNTLWDEDFHWAVGNTSNITNSPTYASTDLGTYDRIFHTHGESTAKWGRTVTDYIANGNMAVAISGSNSQDYYWEIYHVMGDPSLMPYLFVPTPLTVTSNSIVLLGTTQYNVTTEPFALVAISQNGQLISAALSDSNGYAVLSFPALTNVGMLDLVVTAQNKQPSFTQISAVPPTGPYIIYKDHTLKDLVTGNNNGEADYGELVNLDVEVQNIASFPATTLQMTLQSSDTMVTIVDSLQSWSSMLGYADSNFLAAFQVQFSSGITDQYVLPFELKIEDANSNVWISTFQIAVNAPKVEILSFTVLDAAGNGDGKLDPSELTEIKVHIKNTGHADLLASNAILSSVYGGITIQNPQHAISSIPVGATEWATYNVQVASNAFVGAVVRMDCEVSDAISRVNQSIYCVIGSVDEDFETGNLNKFSWLKSGVGVWAVSNSGAFEGSYGVVAENVANDESAELSISMKVLQDDSISFFRKVSSEKNYDYLEFYIDGQLMSNWSGEKAWGRESYAVTAGQHTFKWAYSKDYLTVGGLDKAWIDFIQFPASDVLSGIDGEITDVDFQMYPNPASNYINLQLELNQKEHFKVYIYNAAGQLEKAQDWDAIKGSSTYKLPLDQLQSGMYFIQLHGQNHSFSHKLFILK